MQFFWIIRYNDWKANKKKEKEIKIIEYWYELECKNSIKKLVKCSFAISLTIIRPLKIKLEKERNGTKIKWWKKAIKY